MPRPLPFLLLALLAAAFMRLWQIASVPPGLHYDQATNLLIASEIAFAGARPIFISAFTGREVFFFYWLAALTGALGARVFTLHLAGSFLGMLSVAAAYFAVRHVLAHDRRRVWLAALAAALLASSLWHVLLSRLGYRLLSEPLVQALALGFLFWGLRRLDAAEGRRGLLLIALGGAFTGLAAHTYLAARAFPLPLAVAWGVLLLARPRALWRPLAVYTLAALAVVAPLGWYFYTHPEAFLTRISQVAPGQGDAALLWQSLLAALKMLFISGDPYLRFNMPGRPLFGPLLGAFWVAGLVLTVVRLVRERDPLARAAEALLLAWTPAMLLPTVLAVHEIFPSNVRAIGLIPLVFVPAARGLVEAAGWAHSRLPPSFRSIAPFPALGLATLTFISISTAAAYFGGWARRADVYRANDGDLSAAARWLNAQDTAGAALFMSAIHYRHPTVAVLSPAYDRIRWSTGGAALAIPAEGPALYLFPASASPPADWLLGWESALVAAPPGPDGQPDFHAYRFADTRGLLPGATLPAAANFSNLVEMLAYRPVSAQAGAAVVVDVIFRVLNQPAAGDFRIVADLVDAWGYPWAQSFNDAFPSEQWQLGDTVIARLRIPAPAGLPPGRYWLHLTFFVPSSGERLTTIDASGRFAGAVARAGPLRVPSAGAGVSVEDVTPAVRSSAALGPLRVIGYDPSPSPVLQGAPVPFALYWQAVSAPDEALLLKVELLPAAGGAAFVLEQGGPVRGSYPTDRWQAGEIVIDRHAPRLPRDLPPGEYRLSVSLSDAAAAFGPLLVDPGIEVQAVNRDFSPPAPVYPANLRWGGLIALAGYDVQVESGAQTITLFWQSLAETEADYTVYVHLLDEQGALAAQRDVQPRGNAYPTSLWAQGEFIADAHDFNLPPGVYTLRVGMYVPESGETLGEAALGEVVAP